MSTVNLTLGGVAFRDFEVPEQIVFGGGQTFVAHQIIGGSRIVDALGAVDAEISLDGVFSGPDAIVRVQALDVARSLGGTLPLMWQGFFFSVIIAELVASYVKPWWIPFRLRLVVVADLATVLPNLIEQATLDLMAVTQVYGPQSGLPVQGISVNNLSSINLGLVNASSRLSAVGTIFSGTTSTFNGAPDTGTAVAAIQNMASNAGTLAGLASAQAFLGRAAANLSGASA